MVSNNLFYAHNLICLFFPVTFIVIVTGQVVATMDETQSTRNNTCEMKREIQRSICDQVSWKIIAPGRVHRRHWQHFAQCKQWLLLNENAWRCGASDGKDFHFIHYFFICEEQTGHTVSCPFCSNLAVISFNRFCWTKVIFRKGLEKPFPLSSSRYAVKGILLAKYGEIAHHS